MDNTTTLNITKAVLELHIIKCYSLEPAKPNLKSHQAIIK